MDGFDGDTEYFQLLIDGINEIADFMLIHCMTALHEGGLGQCSLLYVTTDMRNTCLNFAAQSWAG